MGKTIIAFDLDGVIINKPPLIPKSLIERLFRGKGNLERLHYRFPNNKLEQIIRKISHFYLFRPPLSENIAFIKRIAESGKYDLYIVSSRYSFLKKETDVWLKKRKINNFFKEIYLNANDEQPHLFKEKTLRELKPDIFVDDDKQIIEFLKKKISTIKILHYCKSADLENLIN